MVNMFKDTEILTTTPTIAYRKVVSSCDACNGSGRREMKMKISLSHINQEFNGELQVDFEIIRFRKSHEIVNAVDTGTKYGRQLFVQDRSPRKLKMRLEKHWFYGFGVPKHFCTDPEFTRDVIENIVNLHIVNLQQRPSGSSN